MKDEQGFTLVESMLSLLVLSLALLLASRLWLTASSQERRAELQFSISRQAVAAMESWRGANTVAPGTTEREFRVGQVSVRETKEATPEPQGIMRLMLTYAWEEGGRHYAQTWATLHR
ncbi:MAG: prepilin-type N-terminal cleavage/methylation domain-containing protein [Tumebacillaceae bacterium]